MRRGSLNICVDKCMVQCEDHEKQDDRFVRWMLILLIRVDFIHTSMDHSICRGSILYLFKYIQIFVIYSVVHNTKWYFSTENSNQRARWISLINEVSHFLGIPIASFATFYCSLISFLLSVRRVISIFHCFSISFRHPAPDRAFRPFSALHTWIYYNHATSLRDLFRRTAFSWPTEEIVGFIQSFNKCFQTKMCSSILISNDFHLN